MTGLLRRSELALPASNDHMFAKALACGADLVFLDLEDAVPPAFKEESREKAITALTELDWGSTARAVRIKGLDTGSVSRRHHRGRHPGRRSSGHIPFIAST